MKTKDSPGILIPPPMIYAATFGLAYLARSVYPFDFQFFKSEIIHSVGWVLIILTMCMLLPSLWRFWQSKNTLITIKPAKSLQTKGIYALSRNPMYLALLTLYASISCFSGNCWTLLFLPVLFFIINQFIILPEERYLERTFTVEYQTYKSKVRRWI